MRALVGDHGQDAAEAVEDDRPLAAVDCAPCVGVWPRARELDARANGHSLGESGTQHSERNTKQRPPHTHAHTPTINTPV